MSISERFRGFREQVRDFVVQAENPTTLENETLKVSKEITSAISKLQEEQLNMQCSTIDTSTSATLNVHPQLRGSVPILEAQETISREIRYLFIKFNSYTAKPSNPQSVRINELLQNFMSTYQTSIVKDLPTILTNFANELSKLKNII